MFNYRLPPKDWDPIDIKLAKLRMLLNVKEKAFYLTPLKEIGYSRIRDCSQREFVDLQLLREEVYSLQEFIDRNKNGSKN